MMDTGGAKGQSVPMPASEVIAQAGDLLAIAPAMVINEYGMTECARSFTTRRRSIVAGISSARGEIQNSTAVAARDGAGSGHAAADGGRRNGDADVFRSRQRRIRVRGDDGGPGISSSADGFACSAERREKRAAARSGSGNSRRLKRRRHPMSATSASSAIRMQGAENRPGRGSNGRCTGARVRALARPQLRAPTRCDRGNRGLGGIFGRDARKFDRRAAEAVHKRRIEGDGGAAFPRTAETADRRR